MINRVPFVLGLALSSLALVSCEDEVVIQRDLDLDLDLTQKVTVSIDSKANVQMKVGGKALITGKNDNIPYVWESENPSIAYVRNDTLVANSVGCTKVYNANATTEKIEIFVTVTEKEENQ